MSFIDEYNKRFESPADRLYCPCCMTSSDEWMEVYYNTRQRTIVGCDACVFFTDDRATCPVCGAKKVGTYRDKTTKKAVGCEKCISIYNYGDCCEYLKEEMI